MDLPVANGFWFPLPDIALISRAVIRKRFIAGHKIYGRGFLSEHLKNVRHFLMAPIIQMRNFLSLKAVFPHSERVLSVSLFLS